MNDTSRVPLGDVCRQDRVAVRAGELSELRYIGMESVEAGTGGLVNGELSKTPTSPEANSFRFGREHVLYGKLRPYLNKVYVPDFDGKCSTELVPLRATEKVDRRYLAYFLRSPSTVEAISHKVAGARMPRADMAFVMSLLFPLRPLDEQRRIVDLLSRAENIVRMRKEAGAKAREIIPALFIDMFGDPGTNPRGGRQAGSAGDEGHRGPAQVVRLGDVTDIQGGLQVTTKRAVLPLEVPYLRVANVHRALMDLAEVKSIRLTQAELERTKLQAGDLLVVEGHGNPAEIGRVGIWSGGIDPCTHQNHLIRVRCRSGVMEPSYVWAYMNSTEGRQKLLRQGKTTSGLNTISVANVKSVTIPIPPISKQVEFSRSVGKLKELGEPQHRALAHAEQVFQSLLAGVFGE